jgi:hypothetical protein
MGLQDGNIEDAFTDVSQPLLPSGSPPPLQKHGDFVFLRGMAGLNTYVTKRRAERTLCLLLAFYRRWAMTGRVRVALTASVWRDAGDPSRHARERILAHLRRMHPDLVTIHESRAPHFRYRIAKGPAWLQIEREVNSGKKEHDDDDGDAAA